MTADDDPEVVVSCYGSKSNGPPTRVLRRPFEICVFTELMQDLRSGDLCIPASDGYSDYRKQLANEDGIGRNWPRTASALGSPECASPLPP
jgi:hypothetical protein